LVLIRPPIGIVAMEYLKQGPNATLLITQLFSQISLLNLTCIGQITSMQIEFVRRQWCSTLYKSIDQISSCSLSGGLVGSEELPCHAVSAVSQEYRVDVLLFNQLF
jgi:hypothetical protein